MSVVIESFISAQPPYVMVRSTKYSSLYKAILVRDGQSIEAFQKGVAAALGRLLHTEDIYDKLVELYPEAEAEVADDNDDASDVDA